VSYDGIVSRHLNRRLSRPIAALLAPTPVTPNMVTLFTCGLAFATGLLVALGANVAGGVLIQAVSVIDGVDGDLARRTGRASRFGEVLDAVTDRYADAAMIAGMTVFALRFESHGHAEFAGLLALAGSLGVSYSRARIEGALSMAPSDGVFGLASRDVRSLAAAIGTVLGLCSWTLLVLFAASALTVAWRLVRVAR
jgi:phosphatidylglycerophosphate synthase